jgi:hypothetical protein
MTRKAKSICLVLALFLLTFKGFSQDPGDNPDGPPPAVPFDDYLLPILLVAGAVVAFYAIKKMQKKNISHK